MSRRNPGRSRGGYSTAYSTEGPVCRHCGRRLGTCDCLEKKEEPVPDKVTAKLRIEKSGRGGKTVTVIYDLPRNPAFLKKLAKELKAQCGSGGKAGEDLVEIQGDHREKLRAVLAKKGWVVKG